MLQFDNARHNLWNIMWLTKGKERGNVMNFKDKINIAVVAHVDSGKTTVTEQMLFHSGAIKAAGNVDDGTTTTDTLELEKQRGITIRSATVSFDWKDYKINLIDTPGHMDFIAEVERTFSVLDGVVLVISAKEGVQPQTRAIYERLKKLQLPTLIFINKIDRMGVEIEKVRKQISEEISPDCVYLQDLYEDEDFKLRIKEYPLLSEFVLSQLAMYSEPIFEKYDSEREKITETLCQDELYQLISKAQVYPVYYGSGLKDIGIDALLDGIVSWLQVKNRPVVPERSYSDILLKDFETLLTEELSAYVFRVDWVAKNYRKVYIRVYSGGLYFKQRVPLVGSDRIITVNQYHALEQGKEVAQSHILQDDICVMYDSVALRCGQWIGKVTNRRGLQQELNPLLSVQVRPHEPEKRVEVLNALYELDIEDPYLHVRNDEKAITLRLFGRLQQDVIRETLLSRYQLLLDFDEVETVKKQKPKQKITTAIQMGEVYDERTKALLYSLYNPYRAGIAITIEPLPVGSGLVYETKVSYGDLEKSFQNGVSEGVMLGLAEGLGHEIIDTKVTFIDMVYDSVTSTPSDYRNLAPLVVKKALDLAGVDTIQPYMKYVARVPLGYERYITGKLLELEAVIIDSEFTTTEAIYRGEVQLDKVKDYALDIKMYTEGKGSLELEFLEYR